VEAAGDMEEDHRRVARGQAYLLAAALDAVAGRLREDGPAVA
jgi:hypothetical protein